MERTKLTSGNLGLIQSLQFVGQTAPILRMENIGKGKGLDS